MSNSSSTYTVNSSGTVYLRARIEPGCWSDARSATVTVNPLPNQPSSLSVSTNSCGPKVITRGSPVDGSTWYWQTSASGTSTTNSSGSYTVNNSGTVYLRARSGAGCWGPSISINVNVVDVPVAPDAPTATYGFDEAILAMGQPPSGVQWLWQGADPNGTVVPALMENTYAISSPGTYYLRPRSETGGCWGPSVGFDFVAHEPLLDSVATTATSVTVYWTPQGGNETGFIVYRRAQNERVDDYTMVINSLDSDRASYTDQGLEQGTTYYYWVQAKVGGQRSTAITRIAAVTKGINDDFDHVPQYNGNISAVKWSAHGDGAEHAYLYHYDQWNRLTDAQYAQRGETGHFNKDKGRYQVFGITYDANSNIRTMNRSAGELIDQMDYGYFDNGNQLQQVEDLMEEAEGFIDGNKGTADYGYDANGNMALDHNKDISLIEYNHLDLPERVVKGSGEEIRYTYDAAGIKLAQEVFAANGDLEKSTEYYGGILYEDGAVREVAHDEGRALPDATTGDWEYQYHLKDHLGNTRVTFTSRPREHEFLATMETEDAGLQAEEESYFANLAETRATDLFADAGSDGGNEVARLNAVNPIGPALSLPVAVGDSLDMEVYAHYTASSGFAGTMDAGDFLAALAGGFGGVSGGGEGAQAIFDAFDRALGDVGIAGTSDDGVPAAYLNYILFDKDMVHYQHGFKQVSTAALNGHERVSFDADIVVEKEGFVFVYLSNASASGQYVAFDDFRVTLKEHPVVQRDAYYPFGMQMQGLSYQRITNSKNNFLFNQGSKGKNFQGGESKYFRTERVTDLGLNVDMTRYRTYDYQTGRFWQVDPKADVAGQESLTPYHYSLNNPVRYNDPLGDCPPWICGALVSAGTELVTQVAVNAISGKNLLDLDYADIGTAAISGAVSGGIKTVGQIYSASKRISTALKVAKKATSASEEVAKAGVDIKDKDGTLETSTVLGLGGNKEKDAKEAAVDLVAGPSGSGSGKIAKETIDVFNSKSLKVLEKKASHGGKKAKKAYSDAANAVKENKDAVGAVTAVGAGAAGEQIKDEIKN